MFGRLLSPMLGLVVLCAVTGRAQALWFEDRFEEPVNAINTAIWPGTAGIIVEGIQPHFGTNNHYLRISGAGRKALTGDRSAQLNGRTSTFAFDYYEPSSSSNFLVAGYAANTSDINTAGAFVRISLSTGTVVFNGTEGTTLIGMGVAQYPRNRRLTFSLILNAGTTAGDFNGGQMAGRQMEVWYYDWVTGESVYVMRISTETSVRSPVSVGFRTWSTEAGVDAYIDNVKLLNSLTVVTPGLVVVEPPEAPVIPPVPFVHPSLYNTTEELERIRYRISAEPTSAAALGWKQLTNSSYASLNYVHVTYSDVVVMGSGTTPSETQYRNDSQAARGLALRWVLSGDMRYRDKAKTIMNDWANTFVTMSPAAGTSTAQIQLEAAWAAPVWVAAADLLRYYNQGAGGWSAAEIAKFDQMLNYLYAESVKAATRENNWGASAALAMLTVGAYQEDRARFNTGLQRWRDRLAGINNAVASYNDDSIYEVCRDTIHPQYTLTVWAQGAEVAWSHGIDLYGTTLGSETVPQYAKNLEYFAELFMGLRQPPCDSSFTYDYLGQQSKANAYDVGHNHYIHRMNLGMMPVFAGMVTNHSRPGGFDGHFPAWHTLTHGDLSAGLPKVTGLRLIEPTSGLLLATVTNGTRLNLRAFAGTNCVVAAQTTGTVFSVQFRLNGTNYGAGNTSPPYIVGLPAPGNYFLSALPRKSAGLPGDRYQIFMQVVDLGLHWRLRHLGSVIEPAWAKEAGGNMTLVAAGAGAGGTGDQCGAVNAELNGDVQITARTQVTVGTTQSQAGLMLRSGNSPGSPGVFLFARGGGGVEMQVRTGAGLVAAGVGTNETAGPVWLRLVRLNGQVEGYFSADGQTWTPVGSAVVDLGERVYAGVAVASGRPDVSARGEFEKLVVEPLNGVFADWREWMLTRRGETELSGPEADPDRDGAPNLAEYRAGSDPLISDGPHGPMVVVLVDGPALKIRLRERKNAAELGRKFWASPALDNWVESPPISVEQVEDAGAVVVRDVIFAVSGERQFIRAGY